MSLLSLPPAAAPSSSEDTAPERLDAVAHTYLQLMGTRDPALRAHCEAVAKMSLALARELGMQHSRRVRLTRAALMHDVGKLAIPDAVLLKPGPLVPAETEVIMSHSNWGHKIALHAGMLVEARWILHHHERPDGRGYPFGLRGDEIPLESRIILVADAFDAMTTDRPYRPALSTETALAEIAGSAALQFDRDCADALAACALA